MKKVSITGTRNGVNVSFSIAPGDLSVAGAISFLIWNGQLLQQVSATPQVGQATLSSAGVIVVGLAPLAGDSLYAFTTNALTKGLLHLNPMGVINGVNATYTVTTTPPAGSSLLLFRNGVAQEEVSSGPGVGQFSISGGTVTLGSAMLTGEVLDGWCERTVPLPMRALTVVARAGSLLTVNFQVAVGETFSFVVFHQGISLKRVSVAPLAGQFQALPGGQQIRLNFSPTLADTFLIYVVAQEGQAEPPALVTPHFPSYFQLQNELLVMMHEQIDFDETELCLNRCWQNMLEAWEWSIVKMEGVLTTSPAKTAGTLEVTEGNTTVRGTGTVLVVADIGGSLLVGGHHYLLQGVDISGIQQLLRLDTPYVGASNATISYVYQRHIYQLDPDVTDILSMVSEHGVLREHTQTVRHTRDADLRTSGMPTEYARRGMNATGVYEVEFFPVPNARYRIRYTALRRTALTLLAQSIPELSQALLELAAEMACGMVASKCAAQRNYNGATFWQRKGKLHRAAYEDSLKDLKIMDRQRFGRTTEPIEFVGTGRRDMEVWS